MIQSCPGDHPQRSFFPGCLRVKMRTKLESVKALVPVDKLQAFEHRLCDFASWAKLALVGLTLTEALSDRAPDVGLPIPEGSNLDQCVL